MRMSIGLPILSGATLVLLGCAEPTGVVSGKVEYGGKPLPYGNIAFVREDGRTASSIVENGNYKIYKAPVGPVAISVQSMPPPPLMTMMVRPDGTANHEGPVSPKTPGAAQSKAMRIPDRYRNTSTSGLSFTVEPTEQMHDITLRP